jgi:hypothetical protein
MKPWGGVMEYSAAAWERAVRMQGATTAIADSRYQKF